MSESEVDPFAISSQFKELQQEKKKLQNKLDHLRMRKRDLESKQEIVMKKNSLLIQKNDSMSRTVHIAKLKVQETQTQVDKLQKVNDDLQKKVSHLKSKIVQAEHAKENELEKFQGKYDELADCFREARKYYEDCVLHKEIDKWKTTCQNKMNSIENEKGNLNLISKRLENLKLSKVPEEKPPKTVWETYMENNTVLQSCLEKESKVVSENLEKKIKTINDLRESLKSLGEEIEESKRKAS